MKEAAGSAGLPRRSFFAANSHPQFANSYRVKRYIAERFRPGSIRRVTDGRGGIDDPGCVTPGAGVGFLISQLGYLISGRLKDLLAPPGLEPRQFLFLLHVAQSQGTSQQALGQALRIPPSRMVSIVDSLERRGLVE